MTDGPQNNPLKTFMRDLGEFVGHIWHGIKTDPSKPADRHRMVVDKEVREERRGKTILRETVVREIEFPSDDDDDADGEDESPT